MSAPSWIVASQTGPGGVITYRVFNNKIYGLAGVYGGGSDGKLYEWNGVVNGTSALVANYTGGLDNAKLALVVHGGQLYGAIGTPNYDELYVWNGSNAWSQVTTNSGTTHDIMRDMLSYGGTLYGGSGFGKLYAWDGATSWVAKTGSLAGGAYIVALCVLGGDIFGGATDGCLYKWNAVDAWTKVADVYSGRGIMGLCVLNNKIYASTTGGHLLEWNGSSAWVLKAPYLYGSGFWEVYTIAVWGGAIYGTAHTSTNRAVVKWNGVDAWIEFTAPNANTPRYNLLVYNDRLYGDGGSNGNQLMRLLALEVETDAATNVLPHSATLNGQLINDADDTPVSCSFEYGTDTSYGSTTTPGTVTQGNSYSAGISGLRGNTTYHFRAKAVGDSGDTVYGSDLTFYTDTGVPYDVILEVGLNQSIMTDPADVVWTDITTDLMDLKIERGRMHELDRIEAGTATFKLKNTSGNYWRNNSASPLYPYFKPLTLIRFTPRFAGTQYRRFYGVIESIKPYWLDDPGGRVSVVDIGAVDLFKSFSRFNIYNANPRIVTASGTINHSGQKIVLVYDPTYLVPGQSLKITDGTNSEINYIVSIDYTTNQITMLNNLIHTYSPGNLTRVKNFPSVYSGTRIADILYSIGWPAGTAALIDSGNVVVNQLFPDEASSANVPAKLLSENAMTHAYEVQDAETGLFFMARDGTAVYQDSSARTSSFGPADSPNGNPLNTSLTTFHDDGTDSKFAFAQISDDDTFLYNQADISGPSINEYVLTDSSASENGIRALVRSNSLINSNDDALDQAFSIIGRFADSKIRVESLTIVPDASPANLYPLVFSSDISSKITLIINSTFNPLAVNSDFFVERIEDKWSIIDNEPNKYIVTWQLFDVNLFRVCRTLYDGYIENASIVSYAATQSAGSGTSVEDSSGQSYFLVGQQQTSAPGWLIDRGYIEVDTSIIGSGSTIAQAGFYLHVYGGTVAGLSVGMAVNTAFDITVVDNDSVPNPLTLASYGDLLAETTSYGSATISPPGVPVEWIYVPLNASGIAHINKAGTSKFGFRSSRDISATSPGSTSVEFCGFDGKGTAFSPRLVVRLA